MSKQDRSSLSKPQRTSKKQKPDSKIEQIEVNSLNNPSQIKEDHEKQFTAAHGERKQNNLEKIRQYRVKRVASMQERTKICNLLRDSLLQKQSNTKIFIKNMISFFEHYSDIYSNLGKSIGKFQIKKRYENQPMHFAIKQSISELINLNDEEKKQVAKFVDWLDNILVVALKSAEAYFKERMKKIAKDLDASDQNCFDSWAREGKTFQKLTEGNDLLEREIILLQNIKQSNETSVIRASNLYQAWTHVLQEENTIVKLLKDNIIQFQQKFIKLHKRTGSTSAIFKYWSNLPPLPNIMTIYSSFLDDPSVEYINFGSKVKKIGENFQKFINMTYQQVRVGNPRPFLQILIARKFLSKQMLTQRDWKLVKLLFTVDGHLLIFDEKDRKVTLKLLEKGIQLKPTSQNVLQLVGLEEGVLFDFKKKVSLHFETLDEVEEFTYYVKSIPQKKQYQK